MKNTKLEENIEIHKLLWLLIVSKGVCSIGSFRIVLAAGVLIEILIPASQSHSQSKSNLRIQILPRERDQRYIREAAMRRDPLEQTQSNFQKLVRRFRFQAFSFQILETRKGQGVSVIATERGVSLKVDLLNATIDLIDPM